jgi:hypothetical protein
LTAVVFGSFNNAKAMIIVVSSLNFNKIIEPLKHFRSERHRGEFYQTGTTKIFQLNNSNNLLLRDIGTAADEDNRRVYFIPPPIIWDQVFSKVYKNFLRPCKIEFDKITTEVATAIDDDRLATLLIGTNGNFLLAHHYLDQSALCAANLVNVCCAVFKVLLADTMQADVLVYSPISNGPRFFSRNEFRWEITREDDVGSQDVAADDDYFVEENEAIDDDDDDDDVCSNVVKKFIQQQTTKVKPAQLSLPTVQNLIDILVAHRFESEASSHVLGLVLNHFYPQKHIEPQFLRGNDKLVYDMLLENEHVKRLVLTPIRLVYGCSKDTINLYIPKNISTSNESLVYIKNYKDRLSIFATDSQKLRKIYDNTSEYWYSATLCLIEFI